MEPGPVPAGDSVELLAHPHRRQVLSVLRERGPRLTLAEVTRAVTTGDADRDATEREEARLTLHHVHLPKLSAAGLLAYDPEEGIVTLSRLDRRTERLLDDLAAAESR